MTKDPAILTSESQKHRKEKVELIRVFKRTMADKFPNLVKDINLTDSRNKLNKIPAETHHN